MIPDLLWNQRAFQTVSVYSHARGSKLKSFMARAVTGAGREARRGPTFFSNAEGSNNGNPGGWQQRWEQSSLH